MSNPMMHNLREAYRRVYEALGTQDIDQILKPIERPIPKDPATENMDVLADETFKSISNQDHDSHINAHRAFMSTRMVQINPQVYTSLQAHISEHVSMKAQGEVGALIENDPTMQARCTVRSSRCGIKISCNDSKRVATLTLELAQSSKWVKQDPLLLKQRELDLRAMDLQSKADESMMNMELKKIKLKNN